MYTENRTDVHGVETPDRLIALRAQKIQASPVLSLAIGSLKLAFSPRSEGENEEHIQILTEVESALPPIIVHRSTMQVVDGLHRVHAELGRGRDQILAQFFDGTEEETFLLAVSVNTTNGLPLSPVDRTTAATRILATRPLWSDRAVAALAGISASTVAALRRRNSAGAAESPARIGRDGRTRPLNCASGRLHASELIKKGPYAPLRHIAAVAGISPATAADVRDRLQRGLDPVPERQRVAGMKPAPTPPDTASPTPGIHENPASLAELMTMLEKLRRDPSLRFNKSGRDILRLLSVCATAAQERQRILATVPTHCVGILSELFYGYSEIWRSLAEDLARVNKVPEQRTGAVRLAQQSVNSRAAAENAGAPSSDRSGSAARNSTTTSRSVATRLARSVDTGGST
jgi:hypothetical protein